MTSAGPRATTLRDRFRLLLARVRAAWRTLAHGSADAASPDVVEAQVDSTQPALAQQPAPEPAPAMPSGSERDATAGHPSAEAVDDRNEASASEPPPPQPDPGVIAEPVAPAAAQDEASIVEVADPELDALALRIARLDEQIVDLAARQSELEQRVREFEHRQYQALGEVLARCLRLRSEYLHLKAARSGSEEDHNAASAAAAEYDAFLGAQNELAQPLPELAQDERDELRKLYRAAAMRCHPDRVADADKAEAHEMFLRIQQAYRLNDIEGLRRIHARCGASDAFGVPARPVTDKDKLRRIVSERQDQAADLILAIQTLQLSERYRNAMRIEDWDEHFDEARRRFEAECEDLRERIEAYSTA